MAVAAFAALLASLALFGADALWLVPLGGQVAHGHLPHAILLATAPSSGWSDVPALAQLAFWAAYHALGGDRGLVALQVVAAAVGFWALARGLVREAAGGTVLAVSAVVLLGSVTAVFAVGVSLFSLALFPLLLLLLESESRAPSRRIWLAVAIVAVWGNLHGAVLAGWGLLACYAIFDRARRDPWAPAGVLVAATAALHVNPTFTGTVDYYRGVFGNEARRMGVGLWKPLELGGIDLLLIVAAVVLLGLAAGGRPPPCSPLGGRGDRRARRRHDRRRPKRDLAALRCGLSGCALPPARHALGSRASDRDAGLRRLGAGALRTGLADPGSHKRPQLGPHASAGSAARARPAGAGCGRQGVGRQPDRRVPPRPTSGSISSGSTASRAARPRSPTPATCSSSATPPPAAWPRTTRGSPSSPERRQQRSTGFGPVPDRPVKDREGRESAPLFPPSGRFDPTLLVVVPLVVVVAVASDLEHHRDCSPRSRGSRRSSDCPHRSRRS